MTRGGSQEVVLAVCVYEWIRIETTFSEITSKIRIDKLILTGCEWIMIALFG